MGEGRYNRRGHCYAGRRTVLGDGAFRHVDVQVVGGEHLRRDAKSLCIGLYILQGNRGRLLHHIAEVACKRELLSAPLGQRGFNEKNLTSCRRPRQSRDDAGKIVPLIMVGVSLRQSEVVVKMFRFDDRGVILPAHFAQHGFACKRRQ